MLGKIKPFFKETVVEAKKVDWPSRQETLRYTGIVVGICLAVALFLGGLDFVFVRLLGLFIF
ncbi:preprotein translocase subunit SecE [Candidatus Gribaldobacteria bacterium]|nr:preprotein translocase subunit SecE [Candidatus Gribaldobacteria bacterium]